MLPRLSMSQTRPVPRPVTPRRTIASMSHACIGGGVGRAAWARPWSRSSSWCGRGGSRPSAAQAARGARGRRARARRAARAAGADADAAARGVRVAVAGRAQGKPRGLPPERRRAADAGARDARRASRRSSPTSTRRAKAPTAPSPRSSASLAQTQEQLREAAEGLTRSLRSPNVRGKWGEIQLRRIVELAGMIEQCDFVEKATATTEDGSRQTPDLIVKLPGDAHIVIDAKVPIDAYLAATEATTDAERATASRRARAPGARSHPRARREGILEAVPAGAGIRRDVPAARAAAPGGVRTGRHAARAGREPARRFRRRR